MISVLINAYACSPNMGSEPGMAWNWCINMAKHCDLHIITEGEFKEQIEAALPALPQGRNLHFYYNPVTDDIRKMCWNQGDWRFYKHYRIWQLKTYAMALDIIKTTPIDIVHQLNMIGFREPGYLWKISDKPFVWGPVDAKVQFPVAYLQGASLKIKAIVHLKNILTDLQLRYAGRVRKAVNRSSLVLSASSNAQETFRKYFNLETPLLNETGCYIQQHPILNSNNKELLDVLWVGKLDFRKQLGLAIRSVSKAKNPAIKLHIVGGGDAEPYKALAASLNILNQCTWHGMVNHKEVQQLMQTSDLFFFTSVAEGTPHVVLEAISNNLPVLCFDTCGQGDSINEKVGIKIVLSNPQKSEIDFAEKLNYFFDYRDNLKVMSENCAHRQKELSWAVKAETLLAHYERIMSRA